MAETAGRLLQLLSLLQARRDWPGGVLAERLQVSPRTVRRDVDRLRALGYPVQASKGPDGGYRLAAGTDLPPLLFDDEQAVAVALALQTAPTSVAGIDEAAVRALATIRQVMPSRLRHRVDALQVTAVARGRTDRRPRVGTEVLVAIGTAVRAHEVLRFDYLPADGAAPGDRPPRRVEPHHLVTWGGRWYLLAWDLDRRDWRTFRVDRLTPRAATGLRFTPRELPAPDVASYVAATFQAPRWPCEGQVVLQAPAAQVAVGRRAGRGGGAGARPVPGERRLLVVGRARGLGRPLRRRHGDRRPARAARRRRRALPPLRRSRRAARIDAVSVILGGPMARRVRIGTTRDFVSGVLTPVDADGTGLVVARDGDTACAARNRCPHLGLSLTSGPGGTRYAHGVVQCPWHNSRFELCSGRNLDWVTGVAGVTAPRWSRRAIALGRRPAPLVTYPALVENGEVFVEL